jgi:hypothetical protein
MNIDQPTTLDTTSIISSLPTSFATSSSGLTATITGSFPTVVPYPLSYQFRVVEWHKDGQPDGVELQVKCTKHDQYGNIANESLWSKVPRIKLDRV